MFKKIISYGLLFAMLASLPVNVSAANEDISENCIYVSAQGSDKNSGTKESPVKTIEAAQALVRELKQNSDEPITVYIRGGVYEFRKTTNFTDKDSGTETAPVKYVAYNDEEVIFTGARKINVSGFQKVTDTENLDRIPEEARNKVRVTNLKNQGINRIAEFAPASEHGNVVEEGTMYVGLFFNDKEQTLARYPNGANQTLNVESVSGKNICFSDDRPLRWVNAKDAYIMGGIKYNWTFARTPLLGIDTVNKQIIQNGSYDPLARGFWSVQNLIEELDAPGEYYVDEENLLLYFYPPYSVVGSEIEVTTDNIHFFNINNASNITFEGLQFQRIRRSAVILNECNNVDFINCTFKDIMMNGVYMQGCINCDVTDSDFSVIGAAGVVLNGGNETTLEPGNNSAVNCHIYRPGDKQRTYCPGVAVYGVGNRVLNNEIHNAPHNAIFFDGFDHEIKYNEIYDVVKECVDSGAIYGVWGIYKYGVEIAYNYLHDINSIIEDGNHTAAGIYLDDMQAGVNVHHNVLENVQKAIIFGGGASNKGHNNIIINCEQVADMDARGAGWKRQEAYYHGWYTIPNTLEKTPALKKRYEELNDIGELTLTHNNYYPFFAEVYDNLYYNCGAEPNVHDSYKNDENYFTKYENNITASSFNKEAEGIEFADEKNNNYAIKEGAAILEKLPGLAEIDFSKIGLVESKYRKKDDIKLGNFRQYSPFNKTIEISDNGTYVEWENSDNADYYRVTIAEDKEFENIISKEIFQFNYANLKGNTPESSKYYWKVDAISNGRNHPAEKNVDYGVAFEPDTYYVKEDFSDTSIYELNKSYGASDQTAKNENLVFNFEGLNAPTNEPFKVMQSSTCNYLQVSTGDGSNTHTGVYGVLDTPVTKGILVAEFKLRLNAGTADNIRNTSVGGILDEAASIATSLLGNTTPELTASNAFDGKSGDYTNAFSKDDDGFYSLKYVWSRASESDKWAVDIYDAYTDELIVSAVNGLELDSINYVAFLHKFRDTGTGTFDLADIKVYPVIEPEKDDTNNDTILVEEDFSDTTKYTVDEAYGVDAQSTKNENLLFTYEGLQKNEADSFTVKQIDANDPSKGNYLEVGIGTQKKHTAVYGVLDTPITKGALVTEFKLRISEYTAGSKRPKVFIGTFGKDKDDYKYSLRYNLDKSLVLDTVTSWIFGKTDTVTTKFTPDAYGFYSLRYEWSRASEKDNWKVDLYDAYTDNLILSADNVVMDGIKLVRFVHAYEDQTATGTAPIDLADIKVYIPYSEDQEEVKLVTFTSDGVEIANLPATATNLSVSVNAEALAIPTTSTVILAVYSKGRALEAVDFITNTADALEVTGLNLKPGAYAEVLFWHNLNTLRPLREAEILSAEK